MVTNAKNVRESSRVIVALPGALVPSETDFEDKVEVKETSVGGVKSEGMFCDERMLGWGTQVGVAVQAPKELEVSIMHRSKVEHITAKRSSPQQNKAHFSALIKYGICYLPQ